MNIEVPYHIKVRSLPAPVDIPYDKVVDESSLGPIDLDEDIVGPSKSVTILDIWKHTRSIDDDIYAFLGRS